MNDIRIPGRPATVRALDEASRRLVRPEDREEVTQRLHDGTTEPGRDVDAVSSVFELRSRGPERILLPRAIVDEALRDAGKRAPAPVDLRSGDPPTVPDPSRPSSDVFQPERTPRDKPLPLADRPTQLEDRREAVTATYYPACGMSPRDVERDPSRERTHTATTRERALVESVYDSERRFLVIESEDRERGAHIRSIGEALKTSDVFSKRERVLAIHARQRLALDDAPLDGRQQREDQVLAIALVARQLDDKHRETMRALCDQLVKEIPALPNDKQQAVFEDFESFVDTGGANDSHACRRELNNALDNEVVLHKAYVYALALVQPKQRSREVDAADLILSEERTRK